ncbi:Sla2 protein [Saccharomycopsis crataegensis]|uniref:Sla2 protein n=1 Tax=Saccharomycopsis crataegensis TaxID=43959 RepID=A0AAV5QU06_9ASCO|nr:Sla2 protein [Saccharomycopsis crataegensis]
MVDISVNVKKACSVDETAPKRKHVRACIVYTWDHRDSKPFWQSLRITPIQTDEVQVFKALIVIHKVLQEGHQVTLRDAQRNRDFIDGLGKIFHGEGFKGYGKLIREYDQFLMQKLAFHRKYKEFNGTFEYEEYISLRAVSDPNEGYEAILDLMSLQDAIDDLQRVIFASISHDRGSECKISALVPLLTESYGIYKFVTSMLRAMHQSTGSDEALEPLRQRYNSQHARLYEFYADCSSIRYLTSLINVPKLSIDAPDLFVDEETGQRRATPPKEPSPVAAPAPPPKEETPDRLIGQPTGIDFWQNQQENSEAEQARLAQEREAQILAQQQEQLRQQQMFEQQRAELAQQQVNQQQAMFHQQAQGRVAELERDLLSVKNQYDQDQLLLQSYDQRVKQLEQDVLNANQAATQQIASKDQMINSIQEQINLWKNKYESLAKLYSQLRQEHLNLLNKYKKLQQKAASSQEAIDKREKMERDMKAKNIELADLIRERDRARLELDKLRGAKDTQIDRLELEIRTLKDNLDSVEKNQSSNLTAIFSAHKKEIDDLQQKFKQVDGMSPEVEDKLREKEEEIEILQQTMDDTIKQLAESKKAGDDALDEQIDAVLEAHLQKLISIVDSILKSGIARIQDSLFELDSPMQTGNQNSSPAYLLSIIEKAGVLAQDFGTAFNNFIADGPGGNHAAIISTVSGFSTAISDVILNSKGVIRLSKTEQLSESILASARLIAETAMDYLDDLLNENLEGDSDETKTDTVINGVLEIHERLTELSELAETLAPKIELKGELDKLVDDEMNSAAQAIAAATSHLTSLLSSKQLAALDPINMEINKAILAAAIAITNAISLLIQAATDTQNEIVANGKGSSTRAQFYKKHNKWTEGMISAAKSVAAATNILIKTADGCLGQTNSHEELIVASNEVAASTVQLVAAARVKATSASKTQDRLEEASKTVSMACKALVSQVQAMIAKSHAVENDVDFSKLSILDNRKAEMQQQAEIVKLENSLSAARKRLGEIRKYSYQDDSDSEADEDY